MERELGLQILNILLSLAWMVVITCSSLQVNLIASMSKNLKGDHHVSLLLGDTEMSDESDGQCQGQASRF